MFEGTTCSEQLRGVCLNRKTRKTDTKKLITPPYHVELGTAWGLETWHQKLLSKNVKNSVVPQFHSLHSYLPATTTYRVSCMGTRYSPLEYTRAVFSIPAFSCKSLFIQ